MFETVEDVQKRLEGQGYICDRRVATVVYLALKLEKPVLVEGPAGVGKTEAEIEARADENYRKTVGKEPRRGVPPELKLLPHSTKKPSAKA